MSWHETLDCHIPPSAVDEKPVACYSEQARNESVDIEDLLRERRANKLYDDRTGMNVNKKRKAAHEQRASLWQWLRRLWQSVFKPTAN